jgi:hypothetical protein
MSPRQKTILGIVATLLAVPAVAFAATLTLASFGGQTGFIDTAAASSVKILAISGKKETIDCSSTKLTGATSFQINPKATRVVQPGGQTQVTAGTCVITLKVRNTGDVPLDPRIRATAVPVGWGLTVLDGATITKGETANVGIQVTATDKATAGAIAGTLISETSNSGDNNDTSIDLGPLPTLELTTPTSEPAPAVKEHPNA